MLRAREDRLCSNHRAPPATRWDSERLTEHHRFDLNVVNGSTPSQRFYRAETGPTDAPWTVRELVPSGWALSGLTCTQGNSAVTIDQAAASVSIRLVAGDNVTCTFQDALRPPPGTLLLSKITHGAVDTFRFTVRPHGGGEPVATTSATTTTPGEPADAASGPIALEPGRYDVTEHLPRKRGGRWRLTHYNCQASDHGVGARQGSRSTPPPVTVTITAGAGQACVFENRFVPFGGIAITKVTRGATGNTGFQITPEADPSRQFLQSATTTAENQPARARGDSTRRLRLGRYVIQETGTTPERDGRWTLLFVECGGRLRAFSQGQTTVTLTRANPRVRCRFVDAFTGNPPPLPPTPNPQPEPSPPGPQPDLVVTKRALQSRVDFGRIATFEIVVHNQGDAAAQQVIVADVPGGNAQLVSGRPSKGSCNERTPLICRLGAAGQRESLTAWLEVWAFVDEDGRTRTLVQGNFTPTQEYYLGRAVAANAIAKYGLDGDVGRRMYVKRIGDAVVRLASARRAASAASSARSSPSLTPPAEPLARTRVIQAPWRPLSPGGQARPPTSSRSASKRSSCSSIRPTGRSRSAPTRCSTTCRRSWATA